MQDRYAGDVGDFGKFSLLRTLLCSSNYRLGVVWYLYPDESHNDDGRHIDYLDKIDYKMCDVSLVKKLSDIINKGRSVKALEDADLLPDNTVFYSAALTFHIDHPGQSALEKKARQELRKSG